MCLCYIYIKRYLMKTKLIPDDIKNFKAEIITKVISLAGHVMDKKPVL